MKAKSKIRRRKRPARRAVSKRTAGAGSRVTAPVGEQAVLARLGYELFGVCAAALRQFGAPERGRLASALRGSPRRADYAAQMLDDADKLCRVQSRWHRSNGYFDEDGHPKTISVIGPAPSYEALCADCGLAEERRRLLHLALTFRLCSRVDRDRLAYQSDIILFTGVPSLMLAHAVINIQRFLSTNLFNARPGRKLSESLVDRTALMELSEQQFLEFATAMRSTLQDFIESTDRRLLAAVTKDASPKGAAKRLSGVTAFVFRD